MDRRKLSVKAKRRIKTFYRSWEWAKLRYETLKHYGAVCMLCGFTRLIVVDHIRPISRYPDLALDPENVQVLCDLCNRGKSNDDETDFRPPFPVSELTEEQQEHFKSFLEPSIDKILI